MAVGLEDEVEFDSMEFIVQVREGPAVEIHWDCVCVVEFDVLAFAVVDCFRVGHDLADTDVEWGPHCEGGFRGGSWCKCGARK